MITSFFKRLFLRAPDSATDAAAQFSAGYLYGTTSIDKREYILGCFQPNDALTDILNSMNGALKKKDFLVAQMLASDSEPLFEQALANCTDVTGALANLKAYREKFMQNLNV